MMTVKCILRRYCILPVHSMLFHVQSQGCENTWQILLVLPSSIRQDRVDGTD